MKVNVGFSLVWAWVLLRSRVLTEPLSPVEFREPLTVNVTLLIESVGDPNPVTMDFELEIILQLYWHVKWELCAKYFNETFLAILLLKPPKANEYIQVPSTKVKYFWVPDLYYVEGKDVIPPSNINPPRSLLLYNNGENKDCRLVFKSKETVTVGCQFNFKMYPLDINVCYLNMRSFSYPTSRLRFKWLQSRGVLINPNIQTLVCQVQITSSEDFGEWYSLENEGNYDGVRVSFKFSRKLVNQLITTYIPSILLVLVGFSCFWMSVDAGGERITLTITTLLAVYTQITQVRLSIPPTSYLTNIDIWLFATLGFNLLSTLECALIQGIQFREHKENEAAKEVSGEDEAHEEQLKTMRGKHRGPLPFEGTEWEDQAGRSSLGRMYHSIKTRQTLLRRKEDQSFTEYCDGIGRNVLIGSFLVFFIGYVVYMVIVNATAS
ncbi:glycine receptor subunit alpha-4-like [Galendromus occidentalis]|uniref:Glycine receptor subunit alpha-4-like n=1 Tax=Galendromus occidentalis TaxID=34638 RepID=A0AAJ6QRC9_9ACAR|nr:glycine receptor subunit alpha-4-like [Galendromus occidentalis]